MILFTTPKPVKLAQEIWEYVAKLSKSEMKTLYFIFMVKVYL